MLPRVFLFAVLALLGNARAGHGQWSALDVGTQASFRGLAVVDRQVVWASGTQGTFIRTVDGGKTWQSGVVPGAEKLDFRDVEAFGPDIAYLMSAGPGDASRLYKTLDGGKKWTLQYTNPEPKGFFDSLAFWDADHGIAFSDPVRGKYYLVSTSDGGNSWSPLTPAKMPEALPGEGAFAASGTSLLARGDREVWFCTGGAARARLFHSNNRGFVWEVMDTPLVAGTESAGIFSLAWRDAKHGMLVGGDYKKPAQTKATAAFTRDGGATWQLSKGPLPFCSGVAWAGDRWVAVGSEGSFECLEDGSAWIRLDSGNYNAVQFTRDGLGWAVGPKGKVVRYDRPVRK